MATVTKTLYDADFAEWTAHTADLLRQGRVDEVDLAHVVEEIEDLGISNLKAARSHLHRLLMHLIKQNIQPERTGSSWRGSILSARREILSELSYSPSLRRRLSNDLEEIYREAVEDALKETGVSERSDAPFVPQDCPFTLSQLLDSPLDLPRF